MFSSKGQTLMELIVVVSVSVIIIGALVFATISSLRNAQFSKNQAQATKLAQEGIEQVRLGRDRNQCISLDNNVNSWNDYNANCPNSGSIWVYQITGTNNNCENTSTGIKSKCYFNVESNGSLIKRGSQATFPQSFAQGIPQDAPIFRRAVTLSDDSATFDKQKTVTVIVRWRDFSGDHESKLTTILRKI